MADITVTFDPDQFRGDWTLTSTDLLTGDDLKSSIIISLFTAPGAWINVYEPDNWGCRVSELRSAKRSNETLLRARDYCRQALRWLVEDRIAKAVDVVTAWQGDLLAIGITVTQRTATTRFSFVWTEIF